MRAWIGLAFLLVASSASAQSFAIPDGPPARRARHSRAAIVDCAEHGVWRPPEGWTTVAVDGSVLAYAAGRRAVLARTRASSRSTEDLVRSVTRVVTPMLDGPPSLEPVQERRRDRWRVERSVIGRGALAGRPVEVRAIAHGSRAIWITLVATDAPPDVRAAMESAIASWRMLVSHACECGYDCDRRTRGG